MSEVFISYVREDERFVRFLKNILEMNDVRVWLDRENLQPGVRWKSAIESAIRNGTFFLSIHSKAREVRIKSYANEELVVAIEEVRRRQNNKIFLIPIKIDDCEIVDRPIGGGENLLDLNICDLTDWSQGIQKLLRALGVENPIFDDGVPLAPGLPSFVQISGGHVTYRRIDGIPEFMQGIRMPVETGWCQRNGKGEVIAYIEMVAPFERWQQTNKLLQLSGAHAISHAETISCEADSPTTFSFEHKVFLPAGVELFNFVSGRSERLPADTTIFSSFVAKGHIEGGNFVGGFDAYLQPLVPVRGERLMMQGDFELVFSSAFPNEFR